MKSHGLIICLTSALLNWTPTGAQNFAWQPVLTGTTMPMMVTAPGVAQLAADPGDPDGAWACFGNNPNPALGNPPSGGCWRTNDWGSSWALLSSADPVLCPVDGTTTDFDTLCQGDNVLELAVCSSDVIAVGVHEKGFFLSRNGGVNWTNISEELTHDDTGAGHFDGGGGQCLFHGDQSFKERRDNGLPWSGLTLAFDKTDPSCETLWVGVGDIAGFDLTTGFGDHPGIYVTTDAGNKWIERNGGDYDAERADPVACHPLSLTSRTAAPSTLAITRTGPVYMSVVDADLNANLFGMKEGCSQPRVFALENTADVTWTEQANATLNGNERCINTAMFGLSAASITFTQFTESAAGLDYLVMQSQNISTLTDSMLDPVQWQSQGQGILAGLVAMPISWLNRDVGILAITDDFNLNAQNVSPISISPSSIWLVGVIDADGSPPAGGDSSFVYAGPNFAPNWLNTANPAYNPGGTMLVGPTNPLLNESSIVAATWNSTGQKVLVHTLWYDNYDPLLADSPGKPVEPDDGLYRSCPFAPGGLC